MAKEISLERCRALAKELTEKVANIKDWRLRRQIDMRMKKIAQDLCKTSGYVIATPRELAHEYEEASSQFWRQGSPENDRKMLWGIIAGVHDPKGCCRPSFVVFHKF